MKIKSFRILQKKRSACFRKKEFTLPLPLDAYRDTAAYCSYHDYKFSEINHPFIEASFDSLMMAYPEVDGNFFKNWSIYQGHLYCDQNNKQLYVERFPEFSFVKWHDYAYDILPKGASKAVGIHKLLEVLNIQHDHCFAFGDGLNDIEMLSTAGTGIAMGNAVPEAKAAADVVTTSSSNNGILNGLIEVGLLEKNMLLNIIGKAYSKDR